MIWKALSSTVKSVWPMMVIFLVVVIVSRITYLMNHRSRIHIYEELLNLVFIVYAFIMFELLTSTEINTHGGMNLVPFTEMFRYSISSKQFLYNVVGNILIFIPFGYFISHYTKPKKVWPILLVSIVTSSTVEFVQHYIGRSFDIDDIILNVFGAFVGYLIYVGLRSINKHLPQFMKKDFVYNLLCIAIILVVLYFVLIKCGVRLGL